MRVLPLQTRVNKPEHDKIRAAIARSGQGPTAWIRERLLDAASEDEPEESEAS